MQTTSVSISPQTLHDLVMLYLSMHPERLSQAAPPETYPIVYKEIEQRMLRSLSAHPSR